MAIIKIDGQDIEFDGKHTLLQFAIDQGVEIPYFCYHPAMSTPTNCRMCLVEVGFQAKDRATGEFQFDDEGQPIIQWGRKPNTACNTPIRDGMYVKTHRSSEVIKKAQQGVLEYMLINHPLDCPICDQAGECPLQIWTFKYGPEGSRFEVQKQHKEKRVELGPNVVLDQERCINCTRCTRFTEEISGTHQLTIVGRGDKNCPGTPPGVEFDDPYSMNTIDICPVGALTSKQHRFKARVWEMSYSPSIDMNDSTGTNIYVWIRDNKVMRITPRKNMEVNEYWMPDAYRLNVDRYNENRVSGVKIKGDIPINFEDGLKQAADLLQENQGKLVLLGSPFASLESNFSIKQLASQLDVDTVYYVPQIEKGAGDDWLMQDDKAPNTKSCEWLGFTAISQEELQKKLDADSASVLYSLEYDSLFSEGGLSLANIKSIIHATQYQSTFEKVDWLLPAATSIEGEGTYINFKDIPQVSKMAKQIKQMTPEMWMRLPKSRIDKAAVAVDRWRNLENIFDVLPSWKMTMGIANELGALEVFSQHPQIFMKLQEEFEALKDIKVSYKAPKEAFKYTQLEYANNWGAR
ncbi:MAG: 2Fe-2S iron-sulfur cluster-binding protein [Bacteroidota bacterium]